MTDGAHDHLTVPAHTHPAPDLSGYVTTDDRDALIKRIVALETAKWNIPGVGLPTFLDEFNNRTVLRGHMGDVVKGQYVGCYYADNYLWNAYGTTNGGGIYDLNQVEIANGLLDILVETKTAIPFGKAASFTGPFIAGFKPVVPGADLSRAGAITGPWIMEFRVRGDKLVGFKGVPMGWTGRKTTELVAGYTFTKSDDVKWPDGEIDIIEGPFDAQPAVYIHHSGAKPTDAASVYQQYFPSLPGTTWQDWHTYRVVFYPSGIAGATWTPKVEVWQDGVLLGRVTDRVPGNMPFRPNFQFEPNLVGTAPPVTTKGHIQLDYIAIWQPA